jgi:hypothetical protein
MASPRASLTSIRIDVSPGELLDKISILEIKSERIADPAKLKNIRHELGLYRDIRASAIPGGAKMDALIRDIKTVNETLWEIEDAIRACESKRDFGARFVELARSVYRTNDRRAEIKREINTLCGSSIIEEKSYTEY